MIKNNSIISNQKLLHDRNNCYNFLSPQDVINPKTIAFESKEEEKKYKILDIYLCILCSRTRKQEERKWKRNNKVKYFINDLFGLIGWFDFQPFKIEYGTMTNNVSVNIE